MRPILNGDVISIKGKDCELKGVVTELTDKMRIYISIPISNLDLATQRVKAAEIAEKIKALGHEPVNPFDTPLAPPEISEKGKYAYYMGRDIEQLLLCDAAYFCEGWHNSKGCLVESYIAETYHIKHYHDLRFIPKAE